ncbi:MAG: HPr family phosphocarrier protein [Treponema sp.]|jgi:phosphotransferase system HPr (HPr) family protein|nr:HPr family phosphocarrier protein [Treponema sp.]
MKIMKDVTITVKNETGLHSRPADMFVRTAKLYQSNIEVSKGAKKANAKTILKVILLNVCENDEITITADGPDEDAALEDLKTLVESNFNTVNPKVQI